MLDVHEGKQERTTGLMKAAGFATSEEFAVEGIMVKTNSVSLKTIASRSFERINSKA